MRRPGDACVRCMCRRWSGPAAARAWSRRLSPPRRPRVAGARTSAWRGAAASLVASYPTRLFASAHLLEARTIEASGVFATATDEFLRLADGSGWVPLADEGGERVFFAVPRSL